MKNRPPLKEKITLFDRISVAFLSGLISFVTALIIWFLFASLLDFEGPYIYSSFKLVVGFAIIMSVLGFLLLDNFIANMLGRLWHFIFDYLK